MGSAYNGAQTLQGEGGDFNVVNTYFLNVYDTATFTGDVSYSGEVTFDDVVTFNDNIIIKGTSTFDGVVTFNNNIIVKGTSTFEAYSTFQSGVSFLNNIFVEGTVKTTDVELGTFSNGSFVPESPRKRLSKLFEDVDDNASDIAANAAAIAAIDTSGGNTSFLALEARTATLENLVAAFNNNNNTDTPIENRITNLEAKVTALISVYQSVKAIHNMPINLP